MVRVKFCGITDIEDARQAVLLGVHALGFVFAPSPRQVSPEKARVIINSLPPFIQVVGVFLDQDPAGVRDIAAFCGLDLIQLHGNESPDMCMELMPRTIKAFCLKDESSLESVEPYRGKARAFLLDTYSQGGERGRTGRTFDWNLALKCKSKGVPVILAGGLNPSNVCDAIRRVRPWAVDVNSGIEAKPGRKNVLLMREMMESVRRVQNAIRCRD